MNTIKEFLKPNRWKAGIFIVISIPFSFLVYHPPTIDTAVDVRGLPFPFYRYEQDFSVIIQGQYPPVIEVFRFWSLLYDIIIWYLLACFIYFIFSKIKNLKK